MNPVVIIANFVAIYSFLILIRVLLTWFPNVDWYNQPFRLLSELTDPYLNLFRSFIPPLGGMDFSPIVALLVLQLVQSQVLPMLGAAFASLQMGLVG
jgi:YggT family protein